MGGQVRLHETHTVFGEGGAGRVPRHEIHHGKGEEEETLACSHGRTIHARALACIGGWLHIRVRHVCRELVDCARPLCQQQASEEGDPIKQVATIHHTVPSLQAPTCVRPACGPMDHALARVSAWRGRRSHAPAHQPSKGALAAASSMARASRGQEVAQGQPCCAAPCLP